MKPYKAPFGCSPSNLFPRPDIGSPPRIWNLEWLPGLNQTNNDSLSFVSDSTYQISYPEACGDSCVLKILLPARNHNWSYIDMSSHVQDVPGNWHRHLWDGISIRRGCPSVDKSRIPSWGGAWLAPAFPIRLYITGKLRLEGMTYRGKAEAWLMMTSSNGTFSALLAICAGNSPVPGEFPTQRPVTRSFDLFFDLRLNKRLSKQSWGWWFETLSCPLWRHRNVIQKLCKTDLANINSVWRNRVNISMGPVTRQPLMQLLSR